MGTLTEPFIPVAPNLESKRDVGLVAPLLALLGELAVAAAICYLLLLVVFSAFSALGLGIHVLSLIGPA